MDRPHPGTVCADYDENSLSRKVFVPVAAFEAAGNADKPGDVPEAKLSARLLQRNRVKHPRFAGGGRRGIGELFLERSPLHLRAVTESTSLVHELANVVLSESRHVVPSSESPEKLLQATMAESAVIAAKKLYASERGASAHAYVRRC